MAETKLKNQAAGLIGAKVYLSADQTINNNTHTKILFNTEEYDTGSAFASNRFTVPTGKGGIYDISAFAYLYTGIVDQGIFYLEVYKNGALAHTGQQYTSGTGGQSTDIRVKMKLVASDYVEFYIYHGMGGNTPKLYANGGLPTHTWAEIQQITNE